MASSEANPLMSAQRTSDLHAALHPLVVLNISDYITRHTLRAQPGPLVGGIIGQQNGREITVEHAFDAHLLQDASVEGGWRLDVKWFKEKLEDMRVVHKDRSLDLVGWFTLLPSTGPAANVLTIHNQILEEFNESAVLLGFSPAELLKQRAGGTLPIAIYESNYELDDSTAADDGEDTTMGEGAQSQQSQKQPQSQLRLKFREIPYSVETGEAEMISVSHVARGGANASATAPATAPQQKPQQQQGAEQDPPHQSKKTPVPVDTGTRKRRAVESVAGPSSAAPASAPTASDKLGGQGSEKDQYNDGPVALTPEEEDTIATLTTKANAIKMLQSRINLLVAYLDATPEGRLARAPKPTNHEVDMTDAPQSASPGDAKTEPMNTDTPQTTPVPGAESSPAPAFDLPTSPAILRRIQALVTRLSLVVPSDAAAFRAEMDREASDVRLISQLSAAIDTLSAAWKVGRLYSTVEQDRASKTKSRSQGNGNGHSSSNSNYDSFYSQLMENRGDAYAAPDGRGAAGSDELHARLVETGML